MDGDWMPVLLASCLRAAAMLGLAWAATSAMRRAAAATRHCVWTCAIAAAGVAPVITAVAPQWNVLPPPPALVALSGLAAPDSALQPRQPELHAPSARLGIQDSPDADRGFEIPDPGTMAMSIWAGGTMAILLYLIVGTTAAWRLRRSATPIDAGWVNDARRVADALGVAQPIRFLESAMTTTPLVCGFWRPLIVMPRGASRWSEARLHVVALHELAHIKRRDGVTQALAQVVCALYWFNPLVWIAARRLRHERERACDDVVLAAGTRGSDYARHLLEIAHAMQPARFPALASAALAMARPSQLEGRLMAILDTSIARSSKGSTRLAAAALVTLVSLPVAAAHVRTTTDSAPAEQDDHAAERQRDWLSDVRQSQDSLRVLADATGGIPSEQRDARNGGDRVRSALDVALYEAAEEGDIEGISELLGAGADVDAVIRGDGSPLIAAARRGNVAVVRFLLDRGANPDLPVAGDGSPLIMAASRGHLPVVQLLLDRGADPNVGIEGDGNPIIMAARFGHIPIVELLLQRGASIDLVVDGDENALISASGAGHLAMVKLLVSRGANVNARVYAERSFNRSTGQVEGEWRTPLSMARRGGHDAVVAYLVSLGAQE
jgi:beta-lactamase regulating signal transducer with metallopeptidase domain/ankyrin repeat protein